MTDGVVIFQMRIQTAIAPPGQHWYPIHNEEVFETCATDNDLMTANATGSHCISVCTGVPHLICLVSGETVMLAIQNTDAA